MIKAQSPCQIILTSESSRCYRLLIVFFLTQIVLLGVPKFSTALYYETLNHI